MIKSKAQNIFDACYISRNYYKNLNKESSEKSDVLIDDYDDDDDDDDDAVDGDENNPGFITDVELEVQIYTIHERKSARPFIAFSNHLSL